MLANGRPEMVARAVKSFLAQSFHGARLLVFETGPVPIVRDPSWSVDWATNYGHVASIGALRNAANTCVGADILLHWDSDDWSHPNRIAEQVALLQSGRPICGCRVGLKITGRCPHGNEVGAECVGYNEMLFWRDPVIEGDVKKEGPLFGEAWLYRSAVPNYAVGTSMCYWRETWERNPFPDRSEGCDDLYWFNKGVKIESWRMFACDPQGAARNGPRMIASIHGGNTCARIDAAQREWTRVVEWDAYVREAMRL
jgi:hypothetical protein